MNFYVGLDIRHHMEGTMGSQKILLLEMAISLQGHFQFGD